MNKPKPNQKRITKQRWISIDTSDRVTAKKNKGSDTFKKTQFDEEGLTTVDFYFDPAGYVESKEPPGRARKYHSLGNRKKGKYYCPYYIKPKEWNEYTKQVEFTEKDEIERVKNFYYHMHDGSSEDPKFKSSEKMQSLETLSTDLASLPPIQKYKQYLISRSLRLPSFLNTNIVK